MIRGTSYRVELAPLLRAGPRHSASETPVDLMTTPQMGAQKMAWWGESSALKAGVPGDLREELPLVNHRAQSKTSGGWTEQLRTRRKEEEVEAAVTGTLPRQRRSESH